MGQEYRREMIHQKYILLLVISVVLIGMVIYETNSIYNDKQYTITVTEKGKINKRSGGFSASKDLVFGEDENGNKLVFENTECFIRGKMFCSYIDEKLTVGSTYKITVIGHRISFFRMYQNIISVEEV